MNRQPSNPTNQIPIEIQTLLDLAANLKNKRLSIPPVGEGSEGFNDYQAEMNGLLRLENATLSKLIERLEKLVEQPEGDPMPCASALPTNQPHRLEKPYYQVEAMAS